MNLYIRILPLFFIGILHSIFPLNSRGDSLSNISQIYDSFADKDVTISGKSEVHLTSDMPLVDATVNLEGDDAWLYLDNVKPSVVISDFLDKIKIEGQAAVLNDNVRLQIYRHGTAVVPNFKNQANTAFTAYTQPNCSGESKTFGMYGDDGKEILHKELGEGFDNNIRSFKLRKGFMAVIANNPDGTGYSRCYIADNDDLIINELPDGFVTKDGSNHSFVSFVRVVKWERVSKKGIASYLGSNADLLNVTSYYDISKQSNDNPNVDHIFYWHTYNGSECPNSIESISKISHITGIYEPNVHTDIMTYTEPEYIIREWDSYERTGLRLGTPSVYQWDSKNNEWLNRFMALADSLNYRVDFMQIHSYNHNFDIKPTIDYINSIGKGRPAWITEYNNGTDLDILGPEDFWVDKTGVKCDADGVQIPGGEQVTLPNTVGNADIQYRYIKKILEDLDADSRVERHYVNNYAGGDARCLFIEGKKTKAGEYFSEYKADFAYRDANRYDHVWKIAPPFVKVERTLNNLDDADKAFLKWYDHNGETGINYEVYINIDDSEYKLLTTLEPDKDYEYGGTVTFKFAPKMNDHCKVKVRATSYKNEKSLFSRENTISFDKIEKEFKLSATIKDYDQISLSCSNMSYVATAFERADENGIFLPIGASQASSWKSTDEDVIGGHTYRYRAVAHGILPEPLYSNEVEIYLPSREDIPHAPKNIISGAGDGKSYLTWATEFGVSYEVYRSESENGPFEKRPYKIENASFNDTNLKNGTTYYYYIATKRDEITGPNSEIIALTPQKGNSLHIPFVRGTGSSFLDLHAGTTHIFAKNGDATEWVSDRHGNETGAVKFNSEKDHYITCKGNVIINKDFTVAAWMKLSREKSRIFYVGLDEENNKWELTYDGNGNWTYTYITPSAGEIIKTWNAGVPTDWTHVACTQSDGLFNLYINGKMIGSITSAKPITSFVTGYFKIGNSASFSSADNVYDDIYALKKGLDAEGVRELMNNFNMDVDDILEDSNDDLTISISGKDVTIHSNIERSINIYSADGKQIDNILLHVGENIISTLPGGIYIIGNHKVIIR